MNPAAELRALTRLAIDGYRPGEPVRPIPALQQITIPLATVEQVQPKQAAE